MIVADSTVVMNSTRNYVEEQVTTEELVVWTGNRNNEGPKAEVETDSVTLSPKAKELKASKSQSAYHRNNINAKLMILKRLVEKITGEEIQVLDASELKSCDSESAPTEFEPDSPVEHPGKGWGVEYHYEETYLEHEDTSFSASGVVHTADEQEIQFTLNLDLNRDFLSASNLTLTGGDAAQVVDPLVINYEGNAAELRDMKFTFDLNSDGIEDEISSLGPGSGFLALDVNNDGVINNGSELFGTETGDGFEELAVYDADGNNWIDENDLVFNDLQVWTRDLDGNNTLSSLADQGVGAIFLGSLENTFSLTSMDNALLGQVKSFGLYLNENGMAGSVQQINMVV